MTHVVLNCGGGNSIRLGQFFTESGDAWGERDELPKSPLVAKVVSGKDWSDLPGTYTIIRVVSSRQAMEILQQHRIQPGIRWAEVRVAKHRFFAMQTAAAIAYQVLEEPSSVFSPIYRLLPGAEFPEFDIFLDEESHAVLISHKLVAAFQSAGLRGYSTSKVDSNSG